MSTILKSTGIDIVHFSNGLQGGCDSARETDNASILFNGRKFVAEDNSIIQYYVYTFWNSIGQATEPCYDYWMWIINQQDNRQAQEMMKAGDLGGISTEKYATDMIELTNRDILIAQIMRVLIWILWIFLVTFLFIVLCNFLIAYISQSYEDVLENRIPEIYSQRCVLNEEYYLFRRWFFRRFNQKRIKPFDCFLLTFDTHNSVDDDDMDAHLGVIKKVQETLKEHKTEIRDAINQNGIQMNRVQEEMKLYRDLMNNYKKQLSDTGADIITHCNSIILDNNKKIPGILVQELHRQQYSNKKTKVDTANQMQETAKKEQDYEERTGKKYYKH